MPAPFSEESLAPPSPSAQTSQNTTGTYLVTAHNDSSVTLWKRSAGTWDMVATLPPQKSTITGISFAPDSYANTFATCQADGTVTVYTFNLTTTVSITTTATLRDADTLSAIAFSETGLLATLGGGVLRIYGRRWGLLTEMDVEGSDLSFAPGGKALLAGGAILRCTGEDFEWSLFTTVDDPEDVLFVDWGRDGFIGIGRADGVEIWELQRGTPVRIARFENRGVESVKWDPIGSVLTSVHSGGVKKTWAKDGATWKWHLRDVPHQSHSQEPEPMI